MESDVGSRRYRRLASVYKPWAVLYNPQLHPMAAQRAGTCDASLARSLQTRDVEYFSCMDASNKPIWLTEG
jgi:hypothetical protein